MDFSVDVLSFPRLILLFLGISIVLDQTTSVIRASSPRIPVIHGCLQRDNSLITKDELLLLLLRRDFFLHSGWVLKGGGGDDRLTDY